MEAAWRTHASRTVGGDVQLAEVISGTCRCSSVTTHYSNDIREHDIERLDVHLETAGRLLLASSAHVWQLRCIDRHSICYVPYVVTVADGIVQLR